MQIRLCIWQDGTDHGCRINLPDGAEVAPGEEHMFKVTDFRCPNPGSTTIAFQKLQEGIMYFSEAETVTVRID